MEFSYHLRSVAADDIIFSGPGLGSSANCFIADYSPFGVQLDCLSRIFIGRRMITSDKYRYGYQGSEKDDEVKGEGNSYTTHFRQLDTRLGRWLSIDPASSQLPWQSPYCSMDNNPVMYNDVKGDTVDVSNLSNEQQKLLTNELSEITGYDVQVEEGRLLIDKSNPVKGGSKKARKMLEKAIEDKDLVTVTSTHGDTEDRLNINFNFKAIESTMNSASKGVKDNLTVGYGMFFLHELRHTKAHSGIFRRGDGILAHTNLRRLSAKHKGPVVRKMNRVRDQLGLDKRMNYNAISRNAWKEGIYIIALNKKTLKKILKGKGEIPDQDDAFIIDTMTKTKHN